MPIRKQAANPRARPAIFRKENPGCLCRFLQTILKKLAIMMFDDFMVAHPLRLPCRKAP